jgi:predicted DNA-binding ribbon-helix-helix protein
MKKATNKRNQEPSKASLAAMPEFDLQRTKFVRRNPYAERIQKDGGYTIAIDGKKPYFVSVRTHAGRPKRGDIAGPTKVRSVRLPTAFWEGLDKRAAANRTTTQEELRRAIAEHLQPPANPEIAGGPLRSAARKQRR